MVVTGFFVLWMFPPITWSMKYNCHVFIIIYLDYLKTSFAKAAHYSAPPFVLIRDLEGQHGDPNHLKK